MTRNGKTKLGIIGLLPSYYQDVVWRKLAACDELDVTVVYLSDVGIRSDFVDTTLGSRRDWADRIDLSAYRHVFLKNIGSQYRPGLFFRVNPGLPALLARERFDAVLIHGHKTISTLTTAVGCMLSGTPVIYRGEAIDVAGNDDVARKFIRAFDRILLRRVAVVLYSCTGNRNYYEARGVAPHQLMPIPCAVDNDFYEGERARWALERDATRGELGVAANGIVITYLGTLVPWKRVRDIVRAAARLRDLAPEVHKKAHWVFIGEGPEREELETLSRELDLTNITLVGYQEQDQLGKWLSASDIGVVLSDVDRSPKALNEMMNFGLPLICTEPVGTAFDMVRPGRNGYVVPVADVDAVARTVAKLVNEDKLKPFGAESLRIVERYSLDANARAIRDAVQRIGQRP